MDTDWDELPEQGYVKQKLAGSTLASKLRAIVPNSCVLRLLSNVVLSRVRPLADTYSEDLGLNLRVLGGHKGGQTLDIVAVAQMALQCARDDDDRGAFGHIDIRNFHDSISWSEMWRSQRRRNIPEVWSDAAVRLQRCPGVRLSVRNSSTGLLDRNRGALTGNSLAPWFGRLLVEDAFTAVQAQLEKLYYTFMNVVLRPMA